MSDVTAICPDTGDNAAAFLRERGFETAAIQGVVEIPVSVFELVLSSPANRPLFHSGAIDAIKRCRVVCAIHLYGEGKVLEELGRNEPIDRIIYAGTGIPWTNMEQLAHDSERYQELVQDLERLENKCISLDDRNSVRRQQFQQEYEYLQDEVDKTEAALRNNALMHS